MGGTGGRSPRSRDERGVTAQLVCPDAQSGHVPSLGSERRPDVGSHRQSKLRQVFDGTVYRRSVPPLEFLVQRSGTHAAGNLPQSDVGGQRGTHSGALRARSALRVVSLTPHPVTEQILDLLRCPDNNPRRFRQVETLRIVYGFVCSSIGSPVSLMRNRRQP